MLCPVRYRRLDQLQVPGKPFREANLRLDARSWIVKNQRSRAAELCDMPITPPLDLESAVDRLLQGHIG